jgi:hypothetical protein
MAEIEPKKIRDLEVKKQKAVDKMWNHKRMFLKLQNSLPKFDEKISDLKNKQESIYT